MLLGPFRKKEKRRGAWYAVPGGEMREKNIKALSPSMNTGILNQTAQWLVPASESIGLYTDCDDVELPLDMVMLFTALGAVVKETINQRCILLSHIDKGD